MSRARPSFRTDRRGVVQVFDLARYLATHGGLAGTNVCFCCSCGRRWDDAVVTGWTPAPSGRCPYEYTHKAGRFHIGRVEYAR